VRWRASPRWRRCRRGWRLPFPRTRTSDGRQGCPRGRLDGTWHSRYVEGCTDEIQCNGRKAGIGIGPDGSKRALSASHRWDRAHQHAMQQNAAARVGCGARRLSSSAFLDISNHVYGSRARPQWREYRRVLVSASTLACRSDLLAGAFLTSSNMARALQSRLIRGVRAGKAQMLLRP
jgi:hypothetical protein